MRLGLMAIFLTLLAYGEQPGDRARLAGTWQLEKGGDNDDAGSVWTVQNKGDKIRITNSRNQRTLVDFECNVLGRECKIKDAGKTAMVLMWFDGEALVELETRGSEVVKRRFQVSGEGETMQVEVIPISPADKPETLEFKRVEMPLITDKAKAKKL